MDPNRLYASQSSGWFGQMIQRSNDGGKTWEPVGNKFDVRRQFPARISGTTARRIPGNSSASGISNLRSPIPTPFMREWKTPRCSVRPMAAQTWHELPGLREHGRDRTGNPAPAACACTRSFSIANNPKRIFIAISAAGAFRTDDGGKTWQPDQSRIEVRSIFRIPTRKSATAFTTSRCIARVRTSLFMQKHWDVMRSDNAGDSWQEVSGNLPTDFGFAIDVHAHEPETIYVVPIKSDSEHFVHRWQSCAFIAAAPAATNGNR